ncbi:translation initiation factor IF-3 [Anopheles ziemanni]|uniref:translation initiation factor IF-3 n=1 Tax=Anopheles coustani TaxID=139045 RepID=UPI002659EEF4|nr:translation initiation factor IF-3 [Anopheles coustani]XP_058172520.1 translation initiation factor IF-3 [Anopheles ziemanni]
MNFISRIIVRPQFVQLVNNRSLVCRHNPLVAVQNAALFSSKTVKSDEAGKGDASNTTRKPKTSPKVTLISSDESISIVNLDEAVKISNRRNLKLVKISDLDTKTQRPVYRMMSGAEYLTEDLKRREEKKKNKQDAAVKGDKLLTISSRIAEHDLTSKIQNVLKWLNKSFEVRVVITGDGAGNKAKQEDIVQRFEASVKDSGKIVQKRLRDNDLRFNILPSGGGGGVLSGKKGLLDVNDAKAANDSQAVRGFHTECRSMA